MLQIAGIVLVLAAIYAIKAFAITRNTEHMAEQSASFSWMSMREQDRETAAAWAEQETIRPRENISLNSLRRAGGASA